MLGDVVETTAGTRPLAARRRPRVISRDKPAVGGAIGGPKHDRRGVVGRDLGADDQFQAHVLGRPMRPNHAGQAVAIGHRQGGDSPVRPRGEPARRDARPLRGRRSSFWREVRRTWR